MDDTITLSILEIYNEHIRDLLIENTAFEREQRKLEVSMWIWCRVETSLSSNCFGFASKHVAVPVGAIATGVFNCSQARIFDSTTVYLEKNSRL